MKKPANEQREKLNNAKAAYADQGLDLVFFRHIFDGTPGFKGCLMMVERIVGSFELTQIVDGTWIMTSDLPEWTTGPIREAGFHIIKSS